MQIITISMLEDDGGGCGAGEKLWPCGDGVVPKGVEAGKKGLVGAAEVEVPIGLFVCVKVGDVRGLVSEGLQEGVILLGEVVTDGDGDVVGEGEGWDIVEHGAGVVLCSN
jgi:hypothetical protein